MMADERAEQLANKIFTNLDERLEYFENRNTVLAREIPSKWGPLGRAFPCLDKRTEDRRAELACALDQQIAQDELLSRYRDDYLRARVSHHLDSTAALIVFHPKLRAEYFANPDRVLASRIPEKWYSRILRRVRGRPVPEQTRALRVRLASLVEERINLDGRLVSARETYYERESFLKEGMQNPERCFRAVFLMSIMTFVVGVALLLVAAPLAAIVSKDPVQKAVMSGLFGGAGLATTLLAVLRASSQEIRRISGDNALMRMILTDFATEITHLRAISIKRYGAAVRSNREIRGLARDSVSLIATHAMPRGDGRRPQADARERRREELRAADEGRQGLLQRVLRR